MSLVVGILVIIAIAATGSNDALAAVAVDVSPCGGGVGEDPQPMCPGVCTAIFDPVCGKDPITGKTKQFSNACALAASNRCDGTNFVEKCPDAK